MSALMERPAAPSPEPSRALAKPKDDAPASPLPVRWVNPGAGRTSSGERSHYFEPASKSSSSVQAVRRASQAFGQDLSNVRVSTGTPGGADTLGAAVGSHIMLNPSLDSEPPLVREMVLAHELAHVAQQTQDAPALGAALLDPRSVAQHEHAHLEANANAAALSVLTGQRASVVAAPLGLSRCARPAGGMITPAHFKFKTTVPIRPGDTDPAGWQACAIRASMSKDVGGVPYGQIFCIFEVGVPLRNYLGPVSPTYAATVAASAANAAAYTVLSSGTPPSADTCILFRQLMQAEMAELIPGARVGAHVSPVPVVNFP